ncbi:FISUMP domain-containing protein [Alistipes sp.]|uniref:FISUMP domain-containing protein n=1 Tax=Alistipes sp. TaxID=1872444 RepID=UPI003AEFBCBE
MKNYLYRALMLLCCVLIGFSCRQEEPDEEMMLDDVTLNFASAKRSVQVDLPLDEVSNYWHVYAPAQDSWLQYEVIPGRRSLYVAVDGNPTDEVRSSYVMVRSGRCTQRIRVTQDTEGGITLSSDYLPVRYLGASSTLTILNAEFLTDLSVAVEESGADWCSALVEGDRLFVNTRFNDRTEARSALVTVTGRRTVTGEQRTAFLTVYQGRGGMTPYVFELPDFSRSQVYKVMDGGKQVAQIACEFLRAKGRVNARAVVVYPVENDEVDLTMGYVAEIVLENPDLDDATWTYAAPTGAVHGGSVSFRVSDNTLSGYIPGTLAEPVRRVYMPGDVGMGPEEVVGSKEAAVVPHLIEDVRNEETNVYPIVKIGTQYWMGRHLNTAYYNANKNFAAIPTNITASETERRKPNYCIYGFHDGTTTDPAAATNRGRFGLLYPYLTIGGFETVAEAGLSEAEDLIADNLSPEGWIVPTKDEANSLKAYLGGLGCMGRLRRFVDYDAEGEPQLFPTAGRTDDNISGFDAPRSGYRSHTGSWTAGEENGCWMWTRTYQTATSSSMFHVSDVQTSQNNARSMSIRSLNNGAIRIKAQ